MRLVAASIRARDVTVSLYSIGWRYAVTVPAVRFEGSLLEPLPQAGSSFYPVRSFDSEELSIVLPREDNLIAARAEGDGGCEVTYTFTPAAQEALGGHPQGERFAPGPVYRTAVAAISAEPLPASGCDAPYAAARPVNAQAPDYPDLAYQQGARGSVVVSLPIGADGAVLSVRVLRSSGNVSLDRAGSRAAIESTYAPAVFRCEQVIEDVTLRADFFWDSSGRQTQLTME